MKHCILDRHENIAWDIDQTLIGGPNSDRFCEYICAHPEKKHHLVTFRDPEWAEFALVELEGIVPVELIASINAIPQDLWSHASGIIRPNDPAVIKYKHWKATRAKAIGCTILIDDMAETVEEGCREHDVEFLDAYAPWSMNETDISKFLSYVLRHRPEEIGIELDGAGWCDLGDLIRRSQASGQPFDADDIKAVLANSLKARFTISDDGMRIRAAQGHSINVDTAPPADPPAKLYHGTAIRFLDAIKAEGLDRRQRRHVHLSTDPQLCVGCWQATWTTGRAQARRGRDGRGRAQVLSRRQRRVVDRRRARAILEPSLGGGMTKPFSFGAGVLVLNGRKLILQQRSATESEPLTWTCFGGMAENIEGPLRAACRELLEESGIDVGWGSTLDFLDMNPLPGRELPVLRLRDAASRRRPGGAVQRVAYLRRVRPRRYARDLVGQPP